MLTEITLAALDIGSSKIKCIIYNLKDNNYLPIDFFEAPSMGIRNGVVVDFNCAVECIEKNLVNAEEKIGKEIHNIITNFSCVNLKTLNIQGAINFSDHSKVINDKHIKKAISKAINIHLNKDEEFIQMIPQDYMLDNANSIANPLGMSGNKLTVNIHAVVAKTNILTNLINSIGKAGLDIYDIFMSSSLSAQSVLADEEKEIGVVLIDIGEGTSDLIIYKNNKVVFSHVLQIGGELISHDIAEKMMLPLDKAEDIKIRYGYVGDKMPGIEEELLVPHLSGSGKGFRKILTKDVSNVINKKINKIFEQFDEVIKKSGYKDELFAGIVFTGGSSLLRGFISQAKKYFSCPIRMGSVSLNIKNKIYKGPQYAAIAGIGSLIELNKLEKLNCMPQMKLTSIYFEKFKDFFKDLF